MSTHDEVACYETGGGLSAAELFYDRHVFVMRCLGEGTVPCWKFSAENIRCP